MTLAEFLDRLSELEQDADAAGFFPAANCLMVLHCCVGRGMEAGLADLMTEHVADRAAEAGRRNRRIEPACN